MAGQKNPNLTTGTAEAATVDVVVVTWNHSEISVRCIEHLYASTIAVRVIVVDNGSDDDTTTVMRERFPDVVLIELDSNRGFGSAANIGVARAESEYVGMINSDAFVTENYLEQVVARIEGDQRCGFAAGLSINPSTGKVDAAGAIFDRSLRWSPYLKGADPLSAEVDETILASPPTDAMVFRRAAFLEVGGYDQELFAYGEDLDLALRLRAAGWKGGSVPTATVDHLGSMSLGKGSVIQKKLAAYGRGYVAGRYRLGVVALARDVAIWSKISLGTRSTVPLRSLLSGVRRGRELPARPRPVDLHYE